MLQKTKSLLKAVQNLGIKATNLIKKNIPAAISLVLTITAVALTVFCSAHTVSIFDGKRTYTASGLSGDLDKIIAKLELENESFEITDVSNSLFSTKVDINYYLPLTVRMGDKENTYSVLGGKLHDILASLNIIIDEHDTVSIPLNAYIDEATEVEVTDVEFKTVTETVSIPYGKDIVYSDKYDTNTSFVTVGKAGTKTVTSSVKYVNGVATDSVVLNEEITEYAIDATTVYGTSAPKYAGSSTVKADSVPCISTLDAPDDLLLDQNGKPIKYSSKTTLRATAYTHTGNKTSTGVYPQPGHVAVDPREIPYGTKMYIVSADGKYVYGYAIAADTGGFIYGNRTDMDLFLDSEEQCVKFGRRDIVVYFVD